MLMYDKGMNYDRPCDRCGNTHTSEGKALYLAIKDRHDWEWNKLPAFRFLGRGRGFAKAPAVV